MTYGYVDPRSPGFPRSAYCRNVVGVVYGTTAESDGLRALHESGLLLRFGSALEQEPERDATRMAYAREALLYSMKHSGCFDPDWLHEQSESERSASALSASALRRIVDTVLDRASGGRVWAMHGDEYGKINEVLSRDVVTEECPAGFSAMPVRRYGGHDRGIREFCEGEVLYYLGDYDIITRRVREFGGCEVKMNRFTSSREPYGIFFSIGESELVSEEIRGIVSPECQVNHQRIDEARARRVGPKRGLFYAEFNTRLLRMMQGEGSLLEEAFAVEFGEKAMSKDLAEFFDSLKIAESER